MKRAYVRPTMVGERFVANEYVAACDDKGTIYKFECNAGDKGLLMYPYKVYVDSNKNGKYDENDAYLNNYHACGETHEAPAKDGFLNGFMIDSRLGHDHTPQSVIIWRGKKGNNVHCTTNLDMSNWETVKS